ncbi:MAG: helix-turn-helix transcriptional regulator [Rhodobacter sp.]|nr:helix-turn-helix transcriptional regulator [Rhodobacter sp.]
MTSMIRTRGVDVTGRSRHWPETIARISFPLDLAFRHRKPFDGQLRIWNAGVGSLSPLTSDALICRRLPRHVHEPGPEKFPVTLTTGSEPRFVQGGKEVRAKPCAFFSGHSHDPPGSNPAEPADLGAMTQSWDMPGGRIHAPDRFCSRQFDPTNGASGLFVDMVHLIPVRQDSMTDKTRKVFGRQLADLPALAIRSDERVLAAGNPKGRSAHLARIESFVHRHIDDPDPRPDEMAQGCGLSLRCPQGLLRNTRMTPGQGIRDTRLQAAMWDMKKPADRRAVGKIACARGFTLRAPFSRAFRARFGVTPEKVRGKAQGAAHRRGSRAFRGGAKRSVTPTKGEPGHHRPKCARNRARAACRSARAASA